MKRFLYLFPLLVASCFGQGTWLRATGGAVGLAFAHVQGGGVSSNTNSVTCGAGGGTGACTANVISGDLLLLTLNYTAPTTISSDTQTLTWHSICAASVPCGPSGTTADANGCVEHPSGPSYLCMYYAIATSSGAETVTISNFTPALQLDEWSRTSGAWALDVAAGLIGGFNAACTTNPSSAVAGAGELIVGATSAGGGSTTYSVGGSLNTLDSASITPGAIAIGYTLIGGVGAQTFAFSLGASSNWVCSGAAFK